MLCTLVIDLRLFGCHFINYRGVQRTYLLEGTKQNIKRQARKRIREMFDYAVGYLDLEVGKDFNVPYQIIELKKKRGLALLHAKIRKRPLTTEVRTIENSFLARRP